MRARAQKYLSAIEQECERNASFRVESRCAGAAAIVCAASEKSGAAANGSLQAEFDTRGSRRAGGALRGAGLSRRFARFGRKVRGRSGGREDSSRTSCGGGWRSAPRESLIWVTELYFVHQNSVSSCHKFEIRWLGGANVGRLSLKSSYLLCLGLSTHCSYFVSNLQ